MIKLMKRKSLAPGKYGPKADCYERPLLGNTSSHLWPNLHFIWLRFYSCMFSARNVALGGQAVVALVRLSIGFLALPCNQLGLCRDARDQLIQSS